MKDNYGREINYLRISVTDLCNLRCKYCMPEGGIQKKQHVKILTLEEIYEVAKEAVGLGINKIRITGGEPLVRKNIVYLIRRIAQLDGIKDLAMTTNGILLKKYAKELKEAGLNRVNVSLDSLVAEKYKEITRGGNLQDVLDGIKEAREVGLTPLKLNVVLINNFNIDEVFDFVQLTLNQDIDVRFIELMPFGQASQLALGKYISNDEIKSKIKGLIPVEEKQTTAEYYKLSGARGRIGFINPISHHFCATCNKIRLTSDGKLKPCLHTNEEVDLVPALRENDNKLVKTLIMNAISNKPQKHCLTNKDNKPIARNMIEIGG